MEPVRARKFGDLFIAEGDLVSVKVKIAWDTVRDRLFEGKSMEEEPIIGRIIAFDDDDKLIKLDRSTLWHSNLCTISYSAIEGISIYKEESRGEINE